MTNEIVQPDSRFQSVTMFNLKHMLLNYAERRGNAENIAASQHYQKWLNGFGERPIDATPMCSLLVSRLSGGACDTAYQLVRRYMVDKVPHLVIDNVPSKVGLTELIILGLVVQYRAIDGQLYSFTSSGYDVMRKTIMLREEFNNGDILGS